MVAIDMSVIRLNSNAADGAGQSWLDIVRQHVESLSYGTVEIIVHDSQVIQIEKTERLRLGKSSATGVSETTKIEINPSNRSTQKQ